MLAKLWTRSPNKLVGPYHYTPVGENVRELQDTFGFTIETRSRKWNSRAEMKSCTKRIFDGSHFGVVMELAVVMSYGRTCKVETPIHDSIRELVTCECKEHGVKS
jgi:hypothetical protein